MKFPPYKILSIVLIFIGNLIALPSMAAWQATEFFQSPVQNGEYSAQWSSRYTGSLSDVRDSVIDADGNVYSVGAINDGDVASHDIFTSKHSSLGVLLWTARLNFDCTDLSGGTVGCFDEGIAIALDSGGDNVYVVANSHDGLKSDIIGLKYDAATGAEVTEWVGGVRYAATTDDSVIDLVVGSNDEIYVTGVRRLAAAYESDIITLRFDANGAVGWSGSVKLYDSAGTQDADVPVGIGIDPAGNIVVAGVSQGVTDDFVVLKYNAADGSDGWGGPQLYDSGVHDKAMVMVVDSSGDVFVAGWTLNGGQNGDRDIIVVKFSGADGSEVWPEASGPFDSGNGLDSARAITLDQTGNVYLAAKGGGDIFTLKLDGSTGVLVWRAELYDSGGDDDVPTDIIVDASERVFITGRTGTIGGDHDLLSLQYASNGTLADAATQDFGGDENGAAILLGQDSNNNTTVLVSGSSDRANLGEADFLVTQFALMRPDLEVLSSNAPLLWPYGVTIVINAELRNILDPMTNKLANADPSVLGVYLSVSATPQPSDLIPVLTYNSNGLASGDTSGQLSLNWTVLDAFTEGSYYLVVVADDAQTVQEQDETNNMRVGPQIQILDPADLTVTSVSGVASAPAGNNFDVNYTLANLRTTAAGSFNISVVLSQDNLVDAGDVVLVPASSVTVPGIAGGGSYNGIVTVTIPNTLLPGPYYIGLIADVDAVIVESDETNNTATSASTLIVEAIPDLIVSEVTGPLGGVAGLSLDISADVSATAVSADVVDAFDVTIYLSLDSDIDPSVDYLLGSSSVNLADLPLTAGGVTTITVSGVAPANDAVYYLGAVADTGFTVLESDEQNNIGTGSKLISIGLPAGAAGAKPDLLLTKVSTNAASGQRGSQIAVTTQVENILPEVANGPFTVGVYLSQDEIITTSDFRLGERIISNLSGNSSDEVESSFLIPSDTTEDLQWTALVNVTVDGNNTLTSTAGGWFAGASSAQRITADGAVEITGTREDGNSRFIGLAYTDPDAGFSSIDYALQLFRNGALRVFENGDYKGIKGTFVTGDILRIERIGTTVRYLRNGVVQYTSAVPSSGDLLADTSFSASGMTIQGAIINLVPLAAGNYFLGAIVDDKDNLDNLGAGTNRVDELSETNNSSVQTDVTGVSQSMVISVLQSGAQSESSDTSTTSGGGQIALHELVILLLMMFLVRLRMRQDGLLLVRKISGI